MSHFDDTEYLYPWERAEIVEADRERQEERADYLRQQRRDALIDEQQEEKVS